MPTQRSDIGPGDRRALGLAVDPHRDLAGGERHGRLDGGPEPAVEVSSGGDEAHDPDPGTSGAQRGELSEEVTGRLASLVGGEREEPSRYAVVPGRGTPLPS